MASPLVVPVSGYSTLSRFDSEISRSPTLTTVPPLIPRPYAMRDEPPWAAHLSSQGSARRVRSGGLADSAWLGGRLGLADHLEIGPAGRMTAARRLRRFHAGLERRHQVDDLRCGGRGCGGLEQLAGRLALDQIEDLLAIGVVVLRR